ncbi:MAG: hypothetical protein K0S98_1356, partial [Propionibacteriaceae bacterium]|nr:hypothetical protein [Propionibacteriaceae bacterium]
VYRKLNFHDSFAAAFWIALSLHVLAGEWWSVRLRPRVDSHDEFDERTLR